jgi:tetratricopeptide (TPR) repeat protein
MPYWLGLSSALWLLLWLAPSAGAAEITLPRAREQYRLGLELYDERQYEQALERFRTSFNAFPSPNSELYVARCYRAMGRTEEAIVAYERTVRLARERAQSDPKYADTYQVARRELAVLKPLPPPKQRMVAATLTAAGVSAAGFAGFVTFSALASSRYHALERECNPLPCPASQAGAVHAGRTEQLLGNLSLALGITGAATAVTLYVLGRPSTPSVGRLELVGTTLRFIGELR